MREGSLSTAAQTDNILNIKISDLKYESVLIFSLIYLCRDSNVVAATVSAGNNVGSGPNHIKRVACT